MKANELMIGDWVQNPLGAKGYVRAISWIPPDEEGLDSTHLITMVYEGCVYSCAKLEEEDILPVPLTTELLEKNFRGYKRGEGHLAFFVYELNEEYFICGGVGSIYLCTHYDDSEYAAHDDIYLVELRYVHELQHALRLCGIDKEIKL